MVVLGLGKYLYMAREALVTIVMPRTAIVRMAIIITTMIEGSIDDES